MFSLAIVLKYSLIKEHFFKTVAMIEKKKEAVGEVLGKKSFENQFYIIFHWIYPLIWEHIQSSAWETMTQIPPFNFSQKTIQETY